MILESISAITGAAAAKKKRIPAAMISPDRYSSLGGLLFDALVQFKSETALIEASRKKELRRLSYRDVHLDALALSAGLSSLGVGAGTRVAILLSNQSRWLISAAAVFHRGAVIVPLDYKLDAENQSLLLKHAKPDVLITERSMFERFSTGPDFDGTALAKHVLLTDADLEGTREFDAFVDEHRSVDVPERVERRRADAACIVYSSGTGGSPKGCILTHGNYLSQFSSLRELFPMDRNHRYFSILPTNHAIDFMVGFIGPFSGGATVVHQRSLRPEFIRWAMKEYRITHMAIVPLILEAFEQNIREALDEQTNTKRSVVEVLTSLNVALTERKSNVGMSRKLLAPIHKAFGGSLEMFFCGGAFVDRKRAEFFYQLGIPVVIGYGLTEACTVVSVHDLKPFRADSVGKPVSNVDVTINDPNADGVGEVLVSGPTVMAGYLDDPELTRETIRDGVLHTGDLGYLDASGHLHLVGRAKNMIVTAGGKNVYPEDVESVLAQVDADELSVFSSQYLFGADQGGDLTDEILVAVVRADDREKAREQIIQQNRSLPDYKRIQALVFTDDEFPRTASMKVKRAVLAETLRPLFQPQGVGVLERL